MEMSERVIGFDPAGIRRVFAPTYTEAWLEAEAYIRRRPDTGPFDRWDFRCEPRIDYVNCRGE